MNTGFVSKQAMRRRVSAYNQPVRRKEQREGAWPEGSWRYWQTTLGNQSVTGMLQALRERDHEAPGLTRLLNAFELSSPAGLEDIAVRYPSPLAEHHALSALNLGRTVHLAGGFPALSRPEQRRLLAHETLHAVQRHGSGPTADPLEAESEALALAPRMMAGLPISVQRHVAPTTALGNTTSDDVLVAQARRRLPLLRRFVAQWTARNARRLRVARQRDPLLAKRKKIEGEIHVPGTLEAMEKSNIAKLNRKPLRIEVSGKHIKIYVKFHVRFENVRHKGQFATLEKNLKRGIQLIWNQRLRSLLPGRRFTIIPSLTQVAKTAKRDQNYWLITVRPRDNAPVRYPGCRLDQPGQGVVAAVTDSSCAGGVMNIPPSVIGDASTLGHELLHLFGLLDRYALYTERRKGRTVALTVPTRTTGTRKDPLGAETGPMLEEDLAFVFQHLGIFKLEEQRGLDTLLKLEARGMTLYSALHEIRRLEAIIKRGGDPHSLLPVRKHFIPEMVKQTEDL